MAEKWDKQLMEFLKRTGDELKRTGDELKTEAQRLMVEVQDPSKQAKVKEGLENLRTWAMATGKQAADRIETAVRRVEESVGEAFDRNDSASTAAPPPATKPAAKPAAPPASSAEPVDAAQPGTGKKAAAKSGSKSIGRKKKVAAKPASKSPTKPPSKGSSKSIGRKKPARPA